MFIRRAISQEDSIADRRIFVRTQQKGFRFQGEFLLNASRIQIFVAIKLNCGFTFILMWNFGHIGFDRVKEVDRQKLNVVKRDGAFV